MSITMTDLKNDLNKFTTLALTENVYVTKNGKPFIMISNPFQNNLDIANDLAGKYPPTKDFTLDDLRDERISQL